MNPWSQVLVSAAIESFAVPSGDYAEAMTLSNFRIGLDGDLYQLRTAPDGVHVTRYDLEQVPT